MCRSGAGHPKDLIGGLKGGPPSKSPFGEFPLGESLGYPPFSGWSIEPLGT
jgi:hypothetical protein